MRLRFTFTTVLRVVYRLDQSSTPSAPNRMPRSEPWISRVFPAFAQNSWRLNHSSCRVNEATRALRGALLCSSSAMRHAVFKTLRLAADRVPAHELSVREPLVPDPHWWDGFVFEQTA